MMDVDVQGAKAFHAAFPDAVLIFVLPPSADVLRDRLASRSTDSPEALALRLRNARDELRAIADYHYVVVNDDLDRAVGQVGAIIDAESMRRERLRALDEQVADLIAELERGLDAAHGTTS
jgi:guanylate kinase